jgi:type III restriction enzyme
MGIETAKSYQKDAVENALDIFRYTESQIQQASDEASRRAATAHNGYVLLEAPTGSGKTRMAGMIAEELSKTNKHRHNSKVVWFWFTPFAGLVEQTKSSMKENFQGLRIKDLYNERKALGVSSGDVFVTTWASVAASNRNTRKIRMDGDLSVSLDELIPSLRGMGFRIGVVADEAHHGFTRATEAVNFYKQVMQPDFTLLVTATPDDKDIEKFKDAVEVKHLHRICVSRKESVDAGLIKEAVKSVAYIAPPDQRQLVDFALTALADGWKMHGAVKTALANEGINLTPLMLVQVANSDSAVEDAKKRLLAIGVPESKIAWYTADDPNDDLLAVAKDESKEVLIFKVAVALGFDAPRAFTLVSMRGAQDTNFGIQVIGRILRVHSKLQARAVDKSLPDTLRYGYVFLADSDNQSGLTSAGEKINDIRTEMSGICPYTMVVQVAGETQIQIVEDGRQPTFLPRDYKPPEWPQPVSEGNTDAVSQTASYEQSGLLSDLVLSTPESLQTKGLSDSAAAGYVPMQGYKKYAIKSDIPRVFKTERSPLSTNELVKCVGMTVAIDEKVFQAGLRKNIQIKRKEVDIFDGEEALGEFRARLSDVEIARRAQGVLFEAQHIDPRDLFAVLLERLEKEYEHNGLDYEHADLVRSLNLIMATYPNIIKIAARKCAAQYRELIDTAPLPEDVEAPAGSKKSTLNIYGILPDDLNNPEREFAEILDADMTGTVEWWHRNEPRKPHSVGIVMPSGSQYFPDFLVKVKDRTRGDGLLLVEIKGGHILNDDGTLEKTISDHKVYGKPLMLLKQGERFMTVKYDERTDKNVDDQVFRVEHMSEY